MPSKEILPKEKIDTREAQVSLAGDTNFDKIENTLKDKIPNDEKKYNKFLRIFQDIKKQKIFSEDEICNFIKNIKINLLYRQLGLQTEEDPNKIVVEKIDISLGKIIKTNEIKEENINRKTNIINTDTEVVSTNTEVVSTNTEVVSTNTEVVFTNTDIKLEKTDTEKIYEARQATQKSYNTLDEKDKITDEQLQKEKTNIPQIVIDAVNKKTQGTALKTEEFLKFYLIGEKKENKDKAEYKDFMKNYKELKKELEIPEIMSFKEASKPENMDQIIENNKSLRDFTETSDKFDSISAPTLPETKDFDTEFASYVKFIPDETIRKNIEKNKAIIKEFKSIYDKDQEDARNEKGEKAYNEYISAIAEVKKGLPKIAETMIRQRVLGSCSLGLSAYFDTTTLAPSSAGMNKENFADDFDINNQEGYQMQKGKKINEQNDDILYINGKIKGKTIGFYYNLTNPDAQLQSDDFLNFDGASETFAFGKNKEDLSASGGKNNLGVKLPTIQMLSTQAQGVSEKNFSTLLEKASSIEDFESSFKDTITTALLKNYGQEVLVKSRVERDIEKNIVTQTLHNTFIPEVVALEISKTATNKVNNKTARKLLKIRDKSTENMGASELRRLRSLIQRLDPLITKEKHKNLEPKRHKLLKGMANDRTALDYNDERGEKTLKFFKKFSENGQINLDNIERFVTDIEKEESITEDIGGFSIEFQTIEEQEQADGLLENIT